MLQLKYMICNHSKKNPKLISKHTSALYNINTRSNIMLLVPMIFLLIHQKKTRQKRVTRGIMQKVDIRIKYTCFWVMIVQFRK